MRQRFPLVAFVLLSTLLIAIAHAREPELEPPRQVELRERSVSTPPNGGERADTLFLFAAEGPGSYGSPGTDSRGFTFDDLSAPAPAGWFGVDLTAQSDTHWHVSGTGICAGSATDISIANPFDPGDTTNDHALWCGIEGECGWPGESGYGNTWRQSATLDLDGTTVLDSLRVSFVFSADFDGDTSNHYYTRESFRVYLTRTNGEESQIFNEYAPGPHEARQVSILVPGPMASLASVRFHFVSSTKASDEDGYYESEFGAVWLDNIEVVADGTTLFRGDFETGELPHQISTSASLGTGDYSALNQRVFQEDPCTYNPSHVWTFYDLHTTGSEWPTYVVQYGPPYLYNAIQSSPLSVDHNGAPITLTENSKVILGSLIYWDMPLNPLIFWFWQVSVKVEGEECPRPFRNDNTVYYGDDKVWWDPKRDITEAVREAAGDDLDRVEAVIVRLGCIDGCILGWCQTTSWPEHPPGPFIDNVRVMVVGDSPVTWDVSPYMRLQDSFPGVDGNVRIDCALSVQPIQSQTLVIGDSTTLSLSMTSGIMGDGVNVPGQHRPSLYMNFRVIAGPNAGSLDPAMGDPDDADGIWSPHIGTETVHGEAWNVAIADSARSEGEISLDTWAFDLAEDYFEAGDIVELYYRVVAGNGEEFVHPEWAEASDADLRSYHRVRCLPSAGADLLFVEDKLGVLSWWEEAFAYNGLGGYDVFSTQASSSGLQNGLGCRAEPGQLAGYDLVIWDSGNLPSYTLTDALPDDICFDTDLLGDWLDNSNHATGLWLMGNEIATDLRITSDWLTEVLGAERVMSSNYYDELGGVYSPRVFATHAELEWLGGNPHFRLHGSCPNENYDLVVPVGALSEVTHEWEDDHGLDIVAGILNRDPDGDGTTLNSTGHESKTLFNPFTYSQVRDEGYGVPVGVSYARRMVGHVLNAFFGQPLNDVVDAEAPPPATKLIGAHPNPFNPSTRVDFSLAEPGHAILRIYDLAGRRARTLHDGRLDAGTHELEWHGRDDTGNTLASGIYFLQFTANGKTDVDKLVLVK